VEGCVPAAAFFQTRSRYSFKTSVHLSLDDKTSSTILVTIQYDETFFCITIDLRLTSYSGSQRRKITRGTRSPHSDLGCQFAHSALAFYLPDISRAVSALVFIPSRTYQASARPLYSFVFTNCTPLRSVARALNDIFRISIWARTRRHPTTTQGADGINALRFAQAQVLRRTAVTCESAAVRDRSGPRKSSRRVKKDGRQSSGDGIGPLYANT